jgi:hypothetical protein
LLAMTDVSLSNSLGESWWRSLKHQWLFLNTLDSVAAVERLTRSTWTSTTLGCRTRTLVGRRRTRCISGQVPRSRTSLKSKGALHGRREWRRIAPRHAVCASRLRWGGSEDPGTC